MNKELRELLIQEGYRLIRYYSSIKDNNSNIFEDYIHCMYGQDFFSWLFDKNQNLGDNFDDFIEILLSEYDGIDPILYNKLILIEKNKIYCISIYFDDYYCHYFTILTTSSSLVVLNTSEDCPGKVEIMQHDFVQGTRLLCQVYLIITKTFLDSPTQV